MDNKKQQNRIARITLLIICVAILFSKLLEHWQVFSNGVNKIASAAAPIMVGAILAFLLNPILIFFDRCFHTLFQDKLIKDKAKLFKVSRGLSVVCTMVIFLGLLTGLFSLVIPQLIESVSVMISNMETYYNNVMKFVDNIYNNFQSLSISEDVITNVIDTIYARTQDWLYNDVLPNMDKIVLNIGSGVIVGLRFIYNFVVGIIAAIYIMIYKEYLASRGKKVIYALFKVKTANTFLDGLSEAHRIFSQFINGKIIDSIIIGLLAFVLTTIFGVPYAILISTIIGITNVVPFFGPIIGAIPCLFIVLIAEPMMFVVLLIIVIVLQQFDGNILGPKILGDMTGLSSFWVLAAVVVGGGLFGFYGMLLGVPVFACVYTYINHMSKEKLKKKSLNYRSCEFETIKRFDEETGEPIFLTEEESDIRFKKKVKKVKVEAEAPEEE